MAKTRQQKNETVAALSGAFGNKSAIFVNYQGLKVKEADELRRLADKEKISYTVAKKTLMGLALKDKGIDFDPVSLQGMIGVAYGMDEVGPAKLVGSFGKTHQALKILGGIVDGKFMNAVGIEALSALPGRPELLGRLVGTINAPVSGLVNVLGGTLRSLLYVLQAAAART